MDVKLYLALAGSLSIAYVTYNFMNKPRTIVISKDLTKRICQQIKHQMMIVCITYSKAMKKIRQDNADKIKGKAEEIFMNFRNQLSQVYVAKENLILKKYAVGRQTYGKSLQKFKHEKIIVKNTEEIINMMERAINGDTPDFTVPQQVYQSFQKEQLCTIYKEMVTLIGKKVTHKLQQQLTKNKHFNPNNDDDFRNAIRELAIYDVKVNFLKQKGFKQEWGCPNEVFFKYLESEKTKDQIYEKKVVAYEKCYEKIIQIVSVDPKKMTDKQIEEMFERALTQPVPVKPAVQPVAQPIKVAPIEAPKSFAPPSKASKKPQPVDEDAELEAMMMQQLLSRSQEPPRTVSSSLEQSTKLGLTSSEIQNDWEKHGSLTEKPITKLQEATEQVVIGHNDENLLKTEMKVVEQALKEQDNEQIPVVQEQIPVFQQQVAVVEQHVPVVEQSVPIVEQPVPIVEQPVSVVEQQVPVVQEQVPVVEQKVQIQNQAVPQVAVEQIKQENAQLQESNQESTQPTVQETQVVEQQVEQKVEQPSEQNNEA